MDTQNESAPDALHSPYMESFDRSLKTIQESMKNVIQEMVITLEDGTSHVIYVMDIKVGKDGELTIDINTPSENRKDELYVHVEKCIKIQIEQLSKSVKKWWQW